MTDHQNAARTMTADCLCFRARRVSRAITRMYDDALRPLGIQATQLTLLNAVAMLAARGATIARLGEILAMDATTLSRALKPLQAAGLVEVTRMDTDRRVRLARLTDAGERCVAGALPLWAEAHGRVVAALGAESALDLRERFDHVSAAAARASSSATAPS